MQYNETELDFIERILAEAGIHYQFAHNENINLVADSDDVLKFSQCINGKVDKSHGLAQRIEYTKVIKTTFKYPENCSRAKVTNEFGLVQLTKYGNSNIINYGIEGSYIYEKKDGSFSELGQHGDDWIKPEKPNHFQMP